MEQALRFNLPIFAGMSISPERRHIAKVFKQHIEQAIAELGPGYEVSLRGTFDSMPIVIEVKVSAKEGIP